MHSTGTPTKHEQARLDAIHAMPCIACEIEITLSWDIIEQIGPTFAHHIVDKSYREHQGGHMATLPLCFWHHEGRILPGIKATKARMKKVYGPSLAKHGREFNERYGTQQELLVKVDARLPLELRMAA